VRTTLIVLLAGVALLGPAAGADAATCTGSTKVPKASTLKRAAKATVCLINRERRKRGIPGLRTSRRLAKAAGKHSRDMVKRSYFEHTSPSGRDPGERITATGYLASTWGENIAWGSGSLGTPRSVVKAWMKSAGHRENILRRSFKESAVGIAVGAPGPGAGDLPAATYTHDFATPR
jgi:uncharacterized protein YkwD